MSKFDLDAYRSARADTDDEKVMVVAGGEFTLPTRPSLEVMELLGEGRIFASLTALGGSEFVEAIRSAGLTADEMQAMYEAFYGVTAGN